MLTSVLSSEKAKKFFQNDFVKNDDDGSLVQNPISIKLRKCILDCLTFFLRLLSKVSWMRQGDGTIDLLTVGDTTYTGDERINVSYK